MSESQLRRNANRIHEAFSSRWQEGAVNVLPSIKANLSLALRRVLTQEGMGCDTFGPGELEAALRSGVDPSLISVNGTGKGIDLLERAIGVGARVTLDSVRELELARSIAANMGRPATVRLRLRPDYDELDLPSEFFEESVSIRSFAKTYKPGIPTADLVRVGRAALDAAELDVSGVMAHLGRHHHDPIVWRGFVRGIVATLIQLSREWAGWRPRGIDLGGGFPTPRDPTGRTLRRAAGRAPRVAPIEDFAKTITETLREELIAGDINPRGIDLDVEPGRAVYADAGIHLATIVNVKHEAGRQPERWIETDTTEMFLPDLMIEHAEFPIVPAGSMSSSGGIVDVMGISCGFDVLGMSVTLPELAPGDVLAFLDVGAYQDAAASNFNAMPRPATVLVHSDHADVIKRAETVDDVFRRDVIPEHLSVPAPY